MQTFVILTLRPMPSAKFVLIIHHVSRCNRAARPISAGMGHPHTVGLHGEWTNVGPPSKKIIH